jgi:hypothetical protein
MTANDQRLIVSETDGGAWYSDDHYENMKMIRPGEISVVPGKEGKSVPRDGYGDGIGGDISNGFRPMT